MPSSLAAILNGELRFSGRAHFDAFEQWTAEKVSLHIVTYRAFESLAQGLACRARIKIVEPLELEIGSGAHLHQWWLLHIALRQFKSDLTRSEAVVRLRTDMSLPASLPALPLPPGVVYAFSDYIFLAEEATFLATFADMYERIVDKYMRAALEVPPSYVASDALALHAMLSTPGTSSLGGCVHPCERSGRDREGRPQCPAGANESTLVPWRYAPCSRCFPCMRYALKGGELKAWCSEPSFSFHVHAHNASCRALGVPVRLLPRHLHLHWGRDLTPQALNISAACNRY